MPDAIQGKQIVLAGGAGGLGYACALRLHQDGARLIISYRSRRDRAVNAVPLGRVEQADLTQAKDRRALLDTAEEMYGLVVLAGDPARVTSPDQMEDTLRRSHEVNFLGPILLAREAAERMKQRSTAGSIVLVSTMQAMALFPGSTAYAAPKAALLHAARILAKECRGPANVRVNVISPGVMQAGMAEASIASGKYNRFLEEGIVPRFGRADDVARAVRFLLEPDNYITGQALTIDGGLTL
ncbi:MAG: SDR family NAD(P)-dependent oxidoreductase [Bryobacteraceae bacterium]